jgi:hypothetical protein
MANVLSLALRVTADATGLKLDPVQRALVGLGDQADKLTAQFDQFAAGSGAAAAAQADFAARSQELINTLRDNGSATAFAAAFEQLNAEARELAVAFAEGQRVTEANRTEEERRAITLAKLNDLVQKGAIDQETFNRASAEASGANAEAARAAGEAARVQAEAAKVQADALRQRQALEARAASIINANLTAQERYEQSLRELNDLQRQGLLTQEQYNRAVAAARAPLDAAAEAAGRLAEAGTESALQFNELSGIFAILPGPLGNIAGRISGISSASAGLSRIFAGGLTAGINSLSASLLTLAANPVVLAVAGITALVAGAAAAFSGLRSLEDRVERLTRLATQLGISFGFAQVLEEAGTRADVSVGQLSGSFARLQNTLAGAGEESEKAAKALGRLGISVQDFERLSQDEKIELVANSLRNVVDPAERSAAAIALFGRSGVQLLPLFNELEKAAADIERFGTAISDDDRAQLSAFGDSLDAVIESFQGLNQTALIPFTGFLSGLLDLTASVTTSLIGLASVVGTVLGPTLDGFGRIFTVLGGIVETSVNQLNRLTGSARAAAAEAREASRAAAQAEAAQGRSERIGLLLETVTKANTAVDAAIANANRFGAAGEQASIDFASGVQLLNEQLATGQISGPQYIQAYAGLTEQYDEQTAAAKANAAAVQSIIDANLEQIRIDNDFGGDTARFKATESLGKIEAEIAFVKEQGRKAAEAGDKQAAEAANARLAILDQVKARETDIASGLRQQIEAVDALVAGYERQLRITNEFGGDSARLTAAENLAAIENEIARVEEQQRLAREAGDTAAADAATARLASLDQVAARERDIASGAAEEREAAAKAADELTKKLFAEAQKRADAEVAARKKIEEAQAAFRERQFEVDLARLEELNTVRTGSVEVGDIRSGGISAFFATLQEDPAVSEAKKQTAELTKLNKNIAKLEAQRVDILAGTG